MRRVLFFASMAAVLLPAAHATAETVAEKAMAQQIGRELKESGQLRNYQIGVKYENGVVHLGGSVANASQRDTAIRLTQQMDGVARVVSQLQFPNDQPQRQPAPSSISSAFNVAGKAPIRNGASPVTHAYANGIMAQGQRGQSVARMPAPGRANLASARGNMPLPSPWPATGIAGGGIRQASAQGMHHGAGMYPQGSAPSAMGAMGAAGSATGGAVPVGFVPHGSGRGPSYENAAMPGYAWPSYASYPNYAALTYPKQYSPTAWPYIGPFYPYPQVPLAWRKVSLEWDDGWWFLDFSAHNSSH